MKMKTKLASTTIVIIILLSLIWFLISSTFVSWNLDSHQQRGELPHATIGGWYAFARMGLNGSYVAMHDIEHIDR